MNAETLLAHAGFVRAIARSILRDPELADDAVQDTWVAALRRPPRRTGNVRGWLGTVARHFALRRRGREAQRPDRERRAARPEAGSAPGIDEVELTRRIAAAVVALDEPYKTTVLQRFYRDWPPARIARETGTPVNTVKTRLRRAVQRLREQLDREANGRRSSWVPALASLAATGTGTAAALLTAKKVLIGGVVIAAAGVAAVSWQRTSANRETRTEARAPRAPVMEGAAASPLETGPAEPEGKKGSVPVPPALPYSYDGKVVDEQRRGIAGAQVELLYMRKNAMGGAGLRQIARMGLEKRQGISTTTTGADGSFRFPRPVDWVAAVRARRDGYVTGVSLSRPYTVVLRRTHPVSITVTAQGRPVPDTRVAISPGGHAPLRQILFQTTTDDAGRAEVPLIDGNVDLEVDPKSAKLGSVHKRVRLAAGDMAVELPPQKTWRARLVDAASGKPLPEGYIAFVHTRGFSYTGRIVPGRTVHADADGFVDVPWRPRWDAFAAAPGYERIFASGDVIRLRRTMSVTGRVFSPAGRRIAHVPVFVSFESDPLIGGLAGLHPVAGWTDGEGRFEIHIEQYRTNRLPYPPDVGRRTLVAYHERHGLAFSESIAVRPGERAEADLHFGRHGTLNILVRGRDGEPVPDAQPVVLRVDRTAESWAGRREHGFDVRLVTERERARTNASGRLTVGALPAGRYRVTYERVSGMVDVEAGGTHDVDLRIGGPGIRGAVYRKDGTPYSGLRVMTGVAAAITDEQGRFEIADLKPGLHTLRLMRVGRHTYAIEVRAGEEIVVREPSGRTRARIELTGADPATVEHSVMTLSDTAPAHGKVGPLQGGLTFPFLPGRALLFVQAKGHGWRAVEFAATDGDVPVVKVDLPPAGGVSGIVRGLPSGPKWNARVEPYDGPYLELVRTRSPYLSGITHVFHGWDWWTGVKDGRFSIGNLTPGRWRLRIGHQPDGPDFVDVATKDFVVRSGETTEVEVAVPK